MGRGRLTSHDIGSMERLHIYLHERMKFMFFSHVGNLCQSHVGIVPPKMSK